MVSETVVMGEYLQKVLPVTAGKFSMLAKRLIVAIVLIPLGILVMMAGGLPLTITAVIVFGFADWEYWRIFRQGGYEPSLVVLIAGTSALVIARHYFNFVHSDLVLGGCILLAMAAQVIQYEKGERSAAVNFNLTLGGILYVGWLGSYLISVRDLPNGQWWLLLVLPACWLTDGFAFFVGKAIGKHKMSPRVSPKKTWEGYIGGIVFGALGTMMLAYFWSFSAPDITPFKGLILGLTIAVASPLGDLGESMLKREFGVKDSGKMLPGHGGILDRVDSWLWAGVLSYYLIVWVLMP
jgi:phosphatidate cytidylyltransferase